MIGRCHFYIATASGSLLHTPWYKPWLKAEINDAFSGQCLSTTIPFSWAISITLACNKPSSQHSRDQCLIWAYSSNWQLSACQSRLFPNLLALPCRYGCARDWQCSWAHNSLQLLQNPLQLYWSPNLNLYWLITPTVTPTNQRSCLGDHVSYTTDSYSCHVQTV